MPDMAPSVAKTPRVRFAPSPTGFLHVGSARTFIFNWLYARHNLGTMVLRLDDTDVERNTDASVQSIFEGLRWLGLSWDEEYKQSERLALHRQQAEAIFAKGLAYRDFTPAHSGDDNQSSAQGAWLFNPGMRELSREESDRRAAAGEPFALRYRVPRGQARTLSFTDSVYGEQTKQADEVEDFALLRSDGMPTYHLASCADDADLRISHIIRGQDHLTNTFKHLLIFEALAMPASSLRPSSTSSASSAGRPKTTASSCPSTKSARPSPWKTSTAPTPSSTSMMMTHSIPRPSGSTPSTSAPCPSKNSAENSLPSSRKPASTSRRKSFSPSPRSSESASSYSKTPSPPPTSSL
jgi:hypothetical protein